ncbi:MAG: hypothetical protein H7832_05560 [Magnetococcus sp. DMHC-6]
MANIVFGLISMALGLWGLSVWWWSIAEVLRGIVPILLILLGLVALGAGITRMREQTQTTKGDHSLMDEDVLD